MPALPTLASEPLAPLSPACPSCSDEDAAAAAAAGGGLGRGISFRGDSLWAGLAKGTGQDVLAGMTQSRHLYVAEFAAG